VRTPAGTPVPRTPRQPHRAASTSTSTTAPKRRSSRRRGRRLVAVSDDFITQYLNDSGSELEGDEEDEGDVNRIPLILRAEAAKWWQVLKHSTWADFESRQRYSFAPKKPASLIYHEIIIEKQDTDEATETFIAKKRILFSLLETRHSDETQ
jgi:hypothetical protein